MQDPKLRPLDPGAPDEGGTRGVPDPSSGAVRRPSVAVRSPLAGDDDRTERLAEEHTNPEVHLPVDVPPDDLTQMNVVYPQADEGDEGAASLPFEAPFGAHRSEEATTLPIEAWMPAASRSARPRSRTIAVEDEVNTAWSAPISTPPPSSPTTSPATSPPAQASTPPSVVVSPSISSPQPTLPPSSQPWAAGPQGGAGYLAAPSARPNYATVGMDLSMVNGVPTPMPPPPSVAPPPVAPRPASAKVGALTWLMIVLATLAVLAMSALPHLRGAR